MAGFGNALLVTLGLLMGVLALIFSFVSANNHAMWDFAAACTTGIISTLLFTCGLVCEQIRTSVDSLKDERKETPAASPPRTNGRPLSPQSQWARPVSPPLR
jgi:hypothetical protein